MRHLKAGRKFGRTSAHRKALFRNLVGALIQKERISTTLAKAKELRGKVEKTILRPSQPAKSELDQPPDLQFYPSSGRQKPGQP